MAKKTKPILSLIPVFFMIIATIIVLCLPALFHISDDIRIGKRETVNSDMRTLDDALAKYYEDHGAFPEWAEGDQGANRHLSPAALSYSIPTFRVWTTEEEREEFTTLLTAIAEGYPVGYITNYYSDPYARGIKSNRVKKNEPGPTYGYFSDEDGWILFSAGPDYDYDIDPVTDFDSHDPERITALELKAYDPTNGTYSNGDIFRIGLADK